MSAHFAVTAADCRRDTFRCGGAGGQNVNKRATGVRWTHFASGATGECREHRTQLQNEKVAWRRMAETTTFQTWARLHLAALEEGHRSAEARVDEMMGAAFLRVEAGVPARSGDVVG